MFSSDATPLFVDTNLGTHMALPVSPEITAGDLKSDCVGTAYCTRPLSVVNSINAKLVQEHMSCFMNLGEIKVQKLMVKRKSNFYLLTDVMPIKSAFQGLSGTWFLQMHASRLEVPRLDKVLPVQEPLNLLSSHNLSRNNLCEFQTTEYRENQHAVPNVSDDTTSSQSEAIITLSDKDRNSMGKKKKNGKEKAIIEGRIAEVKESCVLELVSDLRSRQQQLQDNTAMDECLRLDKNDHNSHLASDYMLAGLDSRGDEPSMNLSQKTSVTGIISRYFSDFDEVDSCSHHHKHRLEEITSTMRPSECSVDRKSPKREVGSDTDNVCSINSIPSGGSPFEANLVEVEKAVANGSRKRKKNTEILTEASKCRKMFQTPIKEHGVGRRVSLAAKVIRSSDNGKRSSNSMFALRCGKFSAPEPSGVARNIFFDFEINEFND
ncbi:uncharacterized protein M6B38_143580 [Iris pallida]|uniref:Uncharacterized protein n=1 Tax=Iris pallida TaxID=29817 RepID=A0AAX6FA53_IRIPA|nr:uncharacterized protein M6B38_143580 [Iris pallida]